MPRTTQAQVEKIVEVDANVDVEPFIETASLIVDDNCTNSGYSDTKLELIERWLAAHFYTVRDNRVASESAGKGAVSASYQYRVGLFLKNSMQGQQAMLIDNKGNLAKLDRAIEQGQISRPRLMWLGQDDTPEVKDSSIEEADTNYAGES